VGRMACATQGSILAYFLRVDEPTGAMLLDRAMNSRATGCWLFLSQVPGMRLPPGAEGRAIAELDHADPEVVTAAIRMLGRHGSAAALAPLRAAFQRWNAAWTGRAAELVYSQAVERANVKQAMVEEAFRHAIGAGQGWLLRAAQVRELQALCVTDNCRAQTRNMVHDDDTKIMAWRVAEPDGSDLELAQYRFTSIAKLKEMLARYPRGTAFTLQRAGDETGEVTAAITDLIAFAAAQGLSLSVDPRAR
jgi:hypothetical protein